MEYIKVFEGRAVLLVPNPDLFRRPDGVYEPSWAPVFYNPRASLNRDLSVVTLATIGEYFSVNSFNIADILAGVGVRGIRYCLEVPNVSTAVLNDINSNAVTVIKENLALNKLSDRAVVYRSDANALLYKLREDRYKLNFIDIDPYGSPTPFIKSALTNIMRGGFIGVTATDIATLSGIKYLAGSRKYDVKLSRTDFKFEVGLRVLLGYIARRAAESDRYVEPIVSVFHDHYYRLFFRVDRGVSKSHRMIVEELGYILYCRKCLFRRYVNDLNILLDLRCPKCGHGFEVIGPLWIGSMNNKEFISRLEAIVKARYEYLSNFNRLLKLITVIRDEVETPYYYDITSIASMLKVNMPKVEEVIKCLQGRGFKGSRTHLTPTGIKTDADYDTVMECIKSS
ncbi:MAG: tRNA (guanine(10)-N(2))-dimethyltransferase [Sulfolobales archaeon]